MQGRKCLTSLKYILPAKAAKEVPQAKYKTFLLNQDQIIYISLKLLIHLLIIPSKLIKRTTKPDLNLLFDKLISIVYTLDMKTIINIKTDKEVKENAQKVAADLGLTLSAVVNASLKQFIRSKEVYFSAIPRMTPGLEELIGRVQKDYASGKNISPVFNNAKEALDYLHS